MPGLTPTGSLAFSCHLNSRLRASSADPADTKVTNLPNFRVALMGELVRLFSEGPHRRQEVYPSVGSRVVATQYIEFRCPDLKGPGGFTFVPNGCHLPSFLITIPFSRLVRIVQRLVCRG